MFTEKQKELLKDFGSRCYWHGEDTGDYDMQSVEELLEDLWREFSLTMLAPDKGQAAVVKDESGSAPCG